MLIIGKQDTYCPILICCICHMAIPYNRIYVVKNIDYPICLDCADDYKNN